MLIDFDEEEKALLRSLGIDPLQEFAGNNTADACELVSTHLQLHGLTANGELNNIGEICNNIMWKFAEV